MAAPQRNWTRSEIEDLERAVNQISTKIEKQERWRKIADLVQGRGKRECYEKYKSMKESQTKSQAESKAVSDDEDDLDNLLNMVALGSSSAPVPKKKDSCEVFDLSDEDEDLDDLLNSIGGSSSNKNQRAESKENDIRSNNRLNTFSSSNSNSTSNSSSSGGGGIRLGRGVLRAEAKTTDESKNSEEKRSSYGGDSKGEGGGGINTSIGNNNNGAPIAIDPSSCAPATVQKRKLLSIEEANSLRGLLFNDTKKVLPDAWKKQGFFFSEEKGVQYGLVQRSGGPCGVLASVQALVLRHLMHDSGCLENPTVKHQQRALVLTMAEMLVNAASNFKDGHNSCEEVVVCCSTGKDHLYRTSEYKPDGVSDDLELITLEVGGRDGIGEKIGRVAAWIQENSLHHFSDPTGCGAILLLFSVILTRGLEFVKRDMDEGFAGEVRTLLDPHFYMSQEGVNLLITGRAVSNVFDGERRMEDNVSGTNDVVVLRGISSRGCVGFLTLQEAYNYIEVGQHLKVPHCAVWVVYSESHYSVLFANDDTHEKKKFDLFYWDMLANQREPIKLTVCLEHDEELPDVNDERALIPPIDLVIRTKWKKALVDWNGTEEIL